jgi:hypothetical protein
MYSGGLNTQLYPPRPIAASLVEDLDSSEDICVIESVALWFWEDGMGFPGQLPRI